MQACNEAKTERSELRRQVIARDAELQRLKSPHTQALLREGEVRRVHAEMVIAVEQREVARRELKDVMSRRGIAEGALKKVAEERRMLVREKAELVAQVQVLLREKEAVVAAAAADSAAAATAARRETRRHHKELEAAKAEADRMVDAACDQMLSTSDEVNAAEASAADARQAVLDMAVQVAKATESMEQVHEEVQEAAAEAAAVAEARGEAEYALMLAERKEARAKARVRTLSARVEKVCTSPHLTTHRSARK